MSKKANPAPSYECSGCGTEHEEPLTICDSCGRPLEKPEEELSVSGTFLMKAGKTRRAIFTEGITLINEAFSQSEEEIARLKAELDQK